MQFDGSLTTFIFQEILIWVARTDWKWMLWSNVYVQNRKTHTQVTMHGIFVYVYVDIIYNIQTNCTQAKKHIIWAYVVIYIYIYIIKARPYTGETFQNLCILYVFIFHIYVTSRRNRIQAQMHRIWAYINIKIRSRPNLTQEKLYRIWAYIYIYVYMYIASRPNRTQAKKHWLWNYIGIYKKSRPNRTLVKMYSICPHR